MKIGQNIQCQACGASSVIKHASESLLECEYCGAMMTFSVKQQVSINPSSPIKSAKLGLLLVMIPILVIVLMVVFWLAFQNIRKQQSIDTYQAVPAQLVSNSDQTTHLNTVKSTEKLDNIAAIDYSQMLSIKSQVTGKTSSGGQYWIFAVKNHSEIELARPGVMLSLFDQDGKRIEEQGGWSLREVLKPADETAVLLYLDERPTQAVKEQLSTFASKPNAFGLTQVDVKVKNFSVSVKNNQYEIIGDVMNQHDKTAKYVRLIAVAYNTDGEPIGIGNAFSSIKDLAPKQASGFKVRVGTFLQGEPASWQVRALARN